MGLETGLITTNTEINNPGYYMRGRRYNDLAEPGMYNVTKALEQSSNTFFFWLMDKMALHKDVGIDKWHDLVSDFGIGLQGNIDLPYETNGILPDSSYLNQTLGTGKWGLGDLLSLGIGQGFLSVSPLQMAIAVSGIANGGYHVQPHLVHSIKKSDGTMLMTNPEIRKIEWVEQPELAVVKEGMRRVVTNGSGRYYANLDSIAVAGKTGTAQNPHGRDHGWFMSFAPVENPQIAVVVFVENSGYASISAAPIASLLIEKYLRGSIERPYVYNYVKTFEPREESEQQTGG